MILPQRFSKGLGNRKLKGGVSVIELFTISFTPLVLDYVGFEPFVSLSSFMMMLFLLMLKNKLLEPSYIENLILKKRVIKWKRIDIRAEEN